MIKIASLSTIAGALLACGLAAAPAAAWVDRTWVSGKGTDAGTCPVTAPCRTFAFALTETNAGGEIDVLDPAGYGAVTITKAISINNDGVGAATIGTSSGNGITINAGASDSVHLRGLTIEGLGSAIASGIVLNAGGEFEIENCVVRNFSRVGIVISPSAASSFSVSNTIASNNGAGILIATASSAAVTGVLSNVTANNNVTGIQVNGTFTTAASLNVTIVDSEVSNNSTAGVFTLSSSGAAATAVMVRNSVASYSGTGLFAQGTAILRVAHSVVTGNGTGVNTFSGGILDSYGDNDIDGNTNNNVGLLIPLGTH